MDYWELGVTQITQMAADYRWNRMGMMGRMIGN